MHCVSLLLSQAASVKEEQEALAALAKEKMLLAKAKAKAAKAIRTASRISRRVGTRHLERAMSTLADIAMTEVGA